VNSSGIGANSEIPQAAGTSWGLFTLLLGAFLPLISLWGNKLSISSKVLIQFPSFSTLENGGWINTAQIGVLEWCIAAIFLCRLLAIFQMKERYSNIFVEGVSVDFARRWRSLIRRTFVASLIMNSFALYSATALSRNLSVKLVVCYVLAISIGMAGLSEAIVNLCFYIQTGSSRRNNRANNH